MQNPKKNAGDKSQTYRGTDEVRGHQQRAQKTAERDNVRSVLHDLMWAPTANEHMLIL
ncbi:hypothetical protein HKK52_03710 [Pseudomonas sp. ADAK2]|uniref:hypothetical protein n=1 Tax=unclassified Pseudomonas TaxID=196821 RepID=UPI00146394C3|nr:MULTISPECIES: hypothetical protein [unclassified Pseudomonas]QJI40062.1 hypothetical protein HKK53_03705 [Pseudomonas sp. ADAK7]QJI46367.1 hypothetical protein HKK52_03710 [Pseudomonas sp. ADAK2]